MEWSKTISFKTHFASRVWHVYHVLNYLCRWTIEKLQQQNDCFIENHRLFLQSLQKCHNLHSPLKSKHPRLILLQWHWCIFVLLSVNLLHAPPKALCSDWVSALETTFINPYKHTRVKIDIIMYAALSSSLHWRVIFWLPQVIYIGATFLYTQVAHLLHHFTALR